MCNTTILELYTNIIYNRLSIMLNLLNECVYIIILYECPDIITLKWFALFHYKLLLQSFIKKIALRNALLLNTGCKNK